MRERPLSSVPHFASVLLVLGFCGQVIWHYLKPSPSFELNHLPAPPTLNAMQLGSFGEPIGFSKLLLLNLQSFDDQPGVKAAFRQVNYHHVQQWLKRALQLDPRAEYPLFLASHVYGAIGDPLKKQLMFNFVYQEFFTNPNERWEPLTFAAIMTRHQLHDLPTAHQYAHALYQHARGNEVPSWAKQMDIFILKEMNEYGQALSMLDEILQGDQFTDLNELQFLREERTKLRQRTEVVQ